MNMDVIKSYVFAFEGLSSTVSLTPKEMEVNFCPSELYHLRNGSHNRIHYGNGNEQKRDNWNLFN